jgi:L-fucose isomerase-like protein
VVNGMKRMVVGAVGARTSAFKTVRFDELALQKLGITTETVDLSEVIARTNALKETDKKYKAKAALMKAYTGWDGVPQESITNLVKLSVVLDGLVGELNMDALALRCWLELEKQLKVAPCVILSDLNNRGMPAACELDVCNAVAMRALQLASGRPAACLDWNNNYGDDPDKCILFHCGPVAQELMTAKGQIVDHPMFAKALGPGHGFGCNTGRIAPTPMTFASSKTDNGKLEFYVGEGRFTKDKIPPEFFGCAGVAEIRGLESVLRYVGVNGYRHHVSTTPGNVAGVLEEAFGRYLGYGVENLKIGA